MGKQRNPVHLDVEGARVGLLHQVGAFVTPKRGPRRTGPTLSCESSLSVFCIATSILAVNLPHCKKGGNLEFHFM
jgi:hypothetical protein